MKKVEANRYPHSATLFKFCKEALEIRYEGNVKVIDQDVGAILGYDPADCSHWKKGKKNIRALATLRSIATHLSIDERLLIDIAGGQVGLDEAIFEFRGYGTFALSVKSLDSLKKEFFRNPTRWQSDNSSPAFEELFNVNRPAVVAFAEQVTQQGKFTEAPIYLPELFKLYPGISLLADAAIAEPMQVSRDNEGPALKTVIRYRDAELRPYVRFLVAKEFFKHLCESGIAGTESFQKAPAEVMDVQANIFAGVVLVPGKMLRTEVEKIDNALDLISQLAATFWTSKALMNQRLRDYLENYT